MSEGIDFSLYQPQAAPKAPATNTDPMVWGDNYAINGTPTGSIAWGTENGAAPFYEANLGSLGMYGDPNNYNGSNGLNDEFLKNLGYTGGDPYHYASDNEIGPGGIPVQTGYTDEWNKFVTDNDLTFRTRADGPDAGITQAFKSDGSMFGTGLRSKYDPDNAFGVAMLAASLFAGGAVAAAGAGGAEAGAVSGMDLAADAGLGGMGSNGVGGAAAAWDGAAAGAGSGLGGANGSWDTMLTDGYGGDSWDAFGNMGGGGGGSGSWYEPAAGSGSSWLKDLAKTGKDLYGSLKGGTGGAGGSSGAMGPFSGGMSPGDKYRQMLAANAIRDLGQKEHGFQSVWSGPQQ